MAFCSLSTRIKSTSFSAFGNYDPHIRVQTFRFSLSKSANKYFTLHVVGCILHSGVVASVQFTNARIFTLTSYWLSGSSNKTRHVMRVPHCSNGYYLSETCYNHLESRNKLCLRDVNYFEELNEAI